MPYCICEFLEVMRRRIDQHFDRASSIASHAFQPGRHD